MLDKAIGVHEGSEDVGKRADGLAWLGNNLWLDLGSCTRVALYE